MAKKKMGAVEAANVGVAERLGATALKCSKCGGELKRVGSVGLGGKRFMVVLVCGKCGTVAPVVK